MPIIDFETDNRKALIKELGEEKNGAEEYILSTLSLFALLLAFVFLFCPVINELWIK
jgi:hypothetical protein